jgi:hypothetical protein
MHKTKIDYLKGHFSEKDCFSAITKIELDYMTVGTPVIVNMKPFVPNSGPLVHTVYNGPPFAQSSGQPRSQPGRNATAQEPRSQPSRDRQSYVNRYKGNYRTSDQKAELVKKEDVKKISVKDLYKMDVVEANKLLQNRSSKISTMFVFSFYKDYKDYYTHTMQTQHVYFDGKVPLIYDKGHRFELERLSDVHDKGDLSNFAEMVANSLKEDRYINYSFEGVASSNKKYMFEDINVIFNDLKKVFPENFSFFKSVLNNGHLRSLVDTISISFYRMQDVIAIFDSKKTSGMGVEIFLTNSIHKPVETSKSESVATYRFLFSKSRENIFTIDGESIKRQHNKSTNDVLGTAFSVINKNIPIDDNLKKKKKPSRRSICAE